MLAIRDLVKTYPSGVHALKDVTLDVPAGMFGLLGPNGAGKTTLMKILATLLEPNSGTAQLRDIDLITDKRRARRLLGYLPQDFGFYPTLRAEQMLDFFAQLKGVLGVKERRHLVDVLLERVNLSDARRQKLSEFSGGMRQRLGIAQALIGNPQLIIVDEPTAGLDPEERVRFHNLLAESAGEDTVIMLSTHIVSDVSSLCSHMAIIREGKIVVSTTPAAAIKDLDGSIWEATVPHESIAALKTRCRVLSSQMVGGLVRLRVISKNGRPGEEFNSSSAVLEDYYFNLVNEQKRAS
jgi:ABC-type multidrug transport system ATPase subunit